MSSRFASHPPTPPASTIRRILTYVPTHQIMAVISGGTTYALLTLLRKYLLPHLQPPTQSTFSSTSTSLQAQFDQAQSMLNDLQSQTSELESSVEKEKVEVRGVVEEVRGVVRRVEGEEERWRSEMREMRQEVDELKALLPSVSGGAIRSSREFLRMA